MAGAGPFVLLERPGLRQGQSSLPAISAYVAASACMAPMSGELLLKATGIAAQYLRGQVIKYARSELSS